jgi:chemotaxis protein MotB
MAGRTRRSHGGNGLDAWPGYVDALSTLLMVIIFVLLVFVLAQAFLTVTLSGRSHQLDKANQQLSALADALSLERGKTSDLQMSVSQLGKELSARSAERDTLSAQLADANQAIRAATAANARLQSQLADTSGQAATAQTQLADARNQLAEMKRQIAELDKSVAIGKDTLQEKLSDLAKLAEQSRALAALRDELEKQAQDSAARAMTEQQRRLAVQVQLADEKRLGDSARAQIALLNSQIDELKSQLASIAAGLELTQKQDKEKDAQIVNLGQKLNTALAAKVEELQQYRSEFFGKLRNLLANRSGITVVGDRFVFQSEVLFPVGSADLTQAGMAQMTTLAVTIKDIASEIPGDLHWVLRVDGHTDPQPVKSGQFASNWELSAQRAITVVKLLIADGVPADHLAATAFGEYQPFGPGDTPDAYSKDRRIELRLTDR